jgi:NTE family protein
MKFKPGQELSIEELNKRIEMTYGTQYFERITYEIHGEPGHRTLKLNVVERPNIQFRFSYFYDSENKGGIIANTTFRNVIFKSSRLILETNLSSYPTVLADYFKYLGKRQNVALGLSGLYSKKELPLIDSTGVKVNVFGSDYYSGSFKIQSTNFQNSTYGVEVQWSNISLKPKVVYQIIENEDQIKYDIAKLKYSHTLFRAYYKFNNLNDRYFPTKGMSANIEVSTTTKTNGKLNVENFELAGINLGDLELGNESLGDLLETSSINALKMDVTPYIPLNKKLVLLSKAKLKLSSIRDNTLNVTEFDFIGGFTPDLVNATEYYGAASKEYALANYFYGRVGAQYEIFRNIFMQANVNVVTTEFPVTFLYPNADTGTMGGRSTRFGYAAMIGMKSVIGPIKLAVAKDHNRNDWKASLIIGFHY